MNATPPQTVWTVCLLIAGMLAAAAGGCAQGQKENDEFFTSGSREADQRAQQRMAKEQQLQNAGEDRRQEKTGPTGRATAETKRSLYDRLGGEAGINAIVDDFVARALADPRVNWERKGVKRGGFTFGRGKSMEWDASAENVKRLKLHMAQFLSLATGGPVKYQGKEMKSAHAGMRISNPEFDAAVGDLKATLDKLQVPTQEQKELLAVVESTRPQVAEQR